MIKDAIPQIDEMSSSEKLLLLEELWDDLASKPSNVPVHEWQKEELERRYEEYAADPSAGSEWAQVRERLRRAFR